MKDRPAEFDLIAALTSGRNMGQGVLKGVGDDAAVVRGSGDNVLLFTCDAQVEGVHFKDIPPAVLGRRLASVNLSDIAAMGGKPMWALSSLFLSRSETSGASWLGQVYDGLYEALAEHGASVIGGNVSGTAGPLALDLFLVGEMRGDQVMGRDGAKAGHALCVTGGPGESGAGRHLLGAEVPVEDSVRQYLVDRHWNPTARVAAGQWLGRTGEVGACMDVSDGLLQDASHLAAASDVSISVHAASLPISAQLLAGARALEMEPVQLALTGGEDYELLFSTDGPGAASLCRRLEEATGVPAAVIGEVEAHSGEPSVKALGSDGVPLSSGSRGFDHLAPEAEDRDD